MKLFNEHDWNLLLQYFEKNTTNFHGSIQCFKLTKLLENSNLDQNKRSKIKITFITYFDKILNHLYKEQIEVEDKIL